MPSFDVTTGVDLQEVDNAINQVRKELANRYDFKGVTWDIEYKRKEGEILIKTQDETRLHSLWDVLREKLVRRGVSPKNLDAGKAETATLGSVRQVVKLTQGIPIEKAREIVKALKDAKLKKVQAAIQADTVRVTGPKRDDLQQAISLLKGQDFGLELKYGNFRD